MSELAVLQPPLIGFYRWLTRRLVGLPWLRRALGVRRPLEGPPKMRWYHAASAGELEILWPVVLEEGRKGRALAVSLFSASDSGVLDRLQRDWQSAGLEPAQLQVGHSPVEGQWREVLARLRPEIFVTAKYEAWPELWMSLAELDIPLAIIGARPRSSIRWAIRICRWVGSRLPRTLLIAANSDDARDLERAFPGFQVGTAGDPRWDRVLERSKKGNPRAQELVQRFRDRPRPWGVLGSVWPEDLALWLESLRSRPLEGTLWLVPHRVDRASVESLLQLWNTGGLTAVLTTGIPSDGQGFPESDAILVDEVGFLSELYASADWAYVGGGFGKRGVHSTIEPAIHSIPVSCGPAKTAHFPEILELGQCRQLSVLQGLQDLDLWRGTLSAAAAPESLRDGWRQGNLRRLGATQRVLGCLETWLPGSGVSGR